MYSKEYICFAKHQTLSDFMINYNGHVALAVVEQYPWVERHVLKVHVL